MAFSEKYFKIGCYLFSILSMIGILSIIYSAIIFKRIGTMDASGPDNFPPLAILPTCLMVFGATVIFISLLGWFGYIRESFLMITINTIFLFILLIIQITLFFAMDSYRRKFVNTMTKAVDDGWELRDEGVFDAIQKSLKCCGRTSASDYIVLGRNPPNSCCENDQCNVVRPYNFYNGCIYEIRELFYAALDTTSYINMGLIIFELCGFIFTYLLANNVRKNKRRIHY